MSSDAKDVPTYIYEVSDAFVEKASSEIGRKISKAHASLICLFCDAMNTPIYRCHITWKTLKTETWGVQFTCSVHELSTFDSRELTQLVLLAHRHAVRVAISPASPSYLKFTLSQREPWRGNPYEVESGHYHYHPSIEQAQTSLDLPTQWIQDQARYAKQVQQ